MPRYCTDWYDETGHAPKQGPSMEGRAYFESNGWTFSRCEARCDEGIGTCMCPEDRCGVRNGPPQPRTIALRPADRTGLGAVMPRSHHTWVVVR